MPSIPISHRRLGREEGSTLIEAALVLPIVFLLTFGFVQICLILMGIGTTNYASRVALRYASMHSNESDAPQTTQQLTTMVNSYVLRYPSNTVTVSQQFYVGVGMTSPYGTGNHVGLGVIVTVSVCYPFSLMGNTFNSFCYSNGGATIIIT